MADQNEPEVHPLDRDYSQPIKKQRPKVAYVRGLRGFGLVTFLIGFGSVAISAFALGSFPNNGSVEAIGSVVHRLGMFAILIGGILVVVAYRLPGMRGNSSRRDRHRPRPRVWGSLIWLAFWNLVGFVLLMVAFQWNRSAATPTTFLLINGALTIVCSLMVTVGVWHTGILRAYAIGFVVALVMNNTSNLIALGGGNWWGPGFGTPMAHLAVIPISGLACACYWCAVQSSRQRS